MSPELVVPPELLLVLDQVARLALWQTEGWRGFARWLAGAPG